MLISELIDKLQAIRAEHGDVPTLTDVCTPLDGEARMTTVWPVMVRTERFHIIPPHSPKYSEDLPKAVWL